MPAGAGRVRMRMRKRGGRGGSVPGALKYPGGGISHGIVLIVVRKNKETRK